MAFIISLTEMPSLCIANEDTILSASNKLKVRWHCTRPRQATMSCSEMGQQRTTTYKDTQTVELLATYTYDGGKLNHMNMATSHSLPHTNITVPCTTVTTLWQSAVYTTYNKTYLNATRVAIRLPYLHLFQQSLCRKTVCYPIGCYWGTCIKDKHWAACLLHCCLDGAQT